ncbi:MAG: DUF4265 domain-containing protein [Gammaproteobacteria bacterium]
MGNHVKVYFEIPSPDTGEVEVETMWAIPHGEGFKLDNIPFYAKGVAFEDVVSARNIDGCLYVDELLEPSGHSTVRIWFANEGEVQPVRDALKSMGCDTELSDQSRLVAVDIPSSVQYENIRAYLDAGEADGRWDYQEACLGFL